MTISFKIKPFESDLIGKITDRLMAEYERKGAPKHFRDRMAIRMDITACHANGNPLNLDKLLAADDFNFCHDVFGIRNHLDRETGKLVGHFRPRCSLSQSVEA
jgi:hypothetical protein